MKDYQELGQFLVTRGIGSHLQNPDQLVVSNKNPATPDSNSFWVTVKNGRWYVSTWLPAIYEVPSEQNVGDVCETVFRSSSTTIYTIDGKIVEKLKLRRLSDNEIERLKLA